MIEKTPKNANLSNKFKTASRFCVVSLHASLRRPQFGLNSVFLAQKCQSGFKPQSSGFQFSCVCGRRRAPPGAPRSDAGELVPEAGWQDALHLLHDEVERSEQRAEELQDKHERLLQDQRGFTSAWRRSPRSRGGVEGGGGGVGKVPPSDERVCGEREGSVCVRPHLHLHGSILASHIVSLRIFAPAAACTSKSDVCV